MEVKDVVQFVVYEDCVSCFWVLLQANSIKVDSSSLFRAIFDNSEFWNT